jgi:hypothetical protein
MKLQKKILSFIRSRAIAYAAFGNKNSEAICNRLYDRFDKLSLCSDQAIYEEIICQEEKLRLIIPSASSRFHNQRLEWLKLIDYARMQSSDQIAVQ